MRRKSEAKQLSRPMSSYVAIIKTQRSDENEHEIITIQINLSIKKFICALLRDPLSFAEYVFLRIFERQAQAFSEYAVPHVLCDEGCSI